ncbi:MAG: OmpA family protein [Rhodobacteraceae bacterium]|nr:OmpA family protein [Paracoccaceae bacterium]
MTKVRSITLLAAASAIALAGCTDPRYGPGGEREKTGQGAAIGAALGGLLGATRESGSDRVKNAAVGAAIGGTIGGLIGSNLDAQARELNQNLDNSQIDVINTGSELIVRMPQDILFAIDSAAVRPDLRSDLGVLAQSLNNYPDTTVEIVGHTDNTGSASYNQNLSELRANSVAAVLINNGVRSSRVRTFGAGESQPIASNLSVQGRAQNRRVDITIRPNR